jgi:hypothetical protein
MFRQGDDNERFLRRLRHLANIFLGPTYYQVCLAKHTWYLTGVPELMALCAAQFERYVRQEVAHE